MIVAQWCGLSVLNYDYHGYHYGCSDNLACPSTI
ncbi:hypothetical protein T4B_13523 [Trichinella pseudospiralis]|uniref:Uncharacterized protein n=1 Tax=Trichinella pseudospiralis TaxID=6337 RepID=A0A0V1GKJ8_TRIPS|nr:hypothetical protein T4B_13523 [Trichinella pseudospiralis]